MRLFSCTEKSLSTFYALVLLAFSLICIQTGVVYASEQNRIISKQSPQTGTVRWFNDWKRYGFIVPDDGTEELYVHHSNLMAEGLATLKQGQRVRFIITEGGPTGRQAANVEVIPDEKPPKRIK